MPDNSKIILITHEFFPKRGGIATYCEEMARAAIEAGYAVDVWAPHSPKLSLSKWPFSIKALPVKGSLNWCCWTKTAYQLFQHRKQLHNCTLYLPEPGPILAAMYLQMGIALPGKYKAITLHGSEILRFAHPPHRAYLFARLLGSMDRIGVVSQHVAKRLLAQFPHLEPKITIVSGAPRSALGSFVAVPRHATRKVRIITVARIHPRKGQHFVITALSKLPEAWKQTIEYQIIGPVVDEAYCKRLEKMAVDSNIAIHFTGEVTDEALHNHYTQADIFVLTSTQHYTSIEGFGLVYLEASAYGLPNIAHATGGVREAVIDGETGIVVTPGNIAHLTTALQQLIADPDLRQQLGESGRKWARRRNWQHNVQALFAIGQAHLLAPS